MNLKRTLLVGALMALPGLTFAGSITSNSQSQTQAQSAASNAGNNLASTNNFNSAPQRGSTTVYETPPIYTAPSTFGFSQNNCGGSDTATVGTPWLGFGGSKSKEMFDCNNRADTIILYQLGLHEAAKLRMVCFGADANRRAFEAAGGVCPSSATAKGIDGAPVGPKFEPAPQLAMTMYGHIDKNGKTVWDKKEIKKIR